MRIDGLYRPPLHAGRPLEVEGFGPAHRRHRLWRRFLCLLDADPLELALEPGKRCGADRRVATHLQGGCRADPDSSPERPDITACYQVLFTSRRTTTGDVKQTIPLPARSIDRSPCGTGTSARVALMHTRGEIGLAEPRKFRGRVGTYFTGEAAAASRRNGVLYVTPRVTGRAFLTGFQPVRARPRRSAARRLPHRPDATARAAFATVKARPWATLTGWGR